MRTISLILVLFLNLLLPGTSLSQWQWQNPLPQGNTLNDLFFIDQTTGWAVGDAGTIMKSNDGGQTYDLFNYPTHLNFSGVEFFDLNTGLVTGDSGIILKTTDGGLTWNQIDRGFYGNITDININNDISWLTCDDGTVFKSIDYGESWQLVYSDPLIQFTSVSFVDASHGWAAGAFESYSPAMIRTGDGGATWSTVDLPSENLVFDICFIDTLTGYVSSMEMYDNYAVILKTTNGGSTWQSLLDDSYYFEFHDIDFTDSDHGWIAGNSATIPLNIGVIFFTSDGGTTWYPGEMNDGFVLGDFNAVNFINDNTGWIVGSLGNFLVSQDGGAHWAKMNTGSNSYCDLEDVFFIDDQNGWAVGATFYPFESRIFHTSDGGNSWTIQPSLDNMLNSVYFADPIEGWIVGGRSLDSYTAAIYHTSNGGEQWEIQFAENINDGDFTDVYFKDTGHGFAIGRGSNIYPPPDISLFFETDDGGETWKDLSLTIPHALSSIFFIDNNTGFIAGHKAILRTDDGGANWNEIWSGPHYLKDIFFTDSNHGWAVGDSASRHPYRDVIMRTTDGGATWEEQFPGFGSYRKQLFFNDNDRGWIARDDGDLLYTKDGGHSWQHVMVNFNGTFGGIFFTDIDNGWVVGADDAIFHISNGGMLGAADNENGVFNSPIRIDCYPNPTSGMVDFRFWMVDGRWSMVNGQWVSLKIYDLHGREVATVVDGRWPGGQVVRWDATGLSAGVYVYQLRAKGEGQGAVGKIVKSIK